MTLLPPGSELPLAVCAIHNKTRKDKGIDNGDQDTNISATSLQVVGSCIYIPGTLKDKITITI